MKTLTSIFYTTIIFGGLAHPESSLSPAFTKRYNIHTVTAGQCYRSKLISEPDDLRTALQALKIKTVLNVCGPCPGEPWWGREKTICTEQGVAHIDITLQAEAYSDMGEVKRLLETFDTASQPFLIHCMRGADRTGEAVALWLRHVQKAVASVALNAIDWRFNHNPFTHWEKRMFMRWLYQSDEVGEIKRSMLQSAPPTRDTFTNSHCVVPEKLYRSHYLYPHQLQEYLATHQIKTVVVLEDELADVYRRDYERICRHHGAVLHQVPLPLFAIDGSVGGHLRHVLRDASAPVLVTSLTGAELCSEAVAWWLYDRDELNAQWISDLFSGVFHCVPGLARVKRLFFERLVGSESLP